MSRIFKFQPHFSLVLSSQKRKNVITFLGYPIFLYKLHVSLMLYFSSIPGYTEKVIHNNIKNEAFDINTTLFIILLIYWKNKCCSFLRFESKYWLQFYGSRYKGEEQFTYLKEKNCHRFNISSDCTLQSYSWHVYPLICRITVQHQEKLTNDYLVTMFLFKINTSHQRHLLQQGRKDMCGFRFCYISYKKT